MEQSPTAKVKVEETMDFPDAMREIIGGKKVKRLEWEEKDYYGHLNGEYLSLHKDDGKNYQWIVSQGDIEADDWIIIK